MRKALDTYLGAVERSLVGVPGGRKRLFLRELECHLLDEAEARGIQDEAGMETLLREKETPHLLAGGLSSEDRVDASHRNGTALLGGALLGAATGGYLWLQGDWPWYLSLVFSVVHGIAVGAGIFLFRPAWSRLGPRARLVLSTLFGTFLAIPLGFTSLRGFVPTRLIYGAFTGFLLERHAQKRPVWQAALEALVFTALDFSLEVLLLHRIRHYQFGLEYSFNLILALAVMAALRLRSVLAGRWVLRSQDSY